MSKYVKDLQANGYATKLEGVSDALLVDVIGIDCNTTVVLRKQLREKNINLLVVKNSLAVRAAEGTPLAAAFEGVSGRLAVVWGGEDFISLAKEITRIAGDKEFKPFTARGGVMDGEQLSPERVKEISKWPSREEQLSILVGQILAPGANIASQLEACGGKIASQIEQIAEGKVGGGSDEASTAAEAAE